MARIAGVNIPDNAQIIIGLQHIYGIGSSNAMNICMLSSINPQTKVRHLDASQLDLIRSMLLKYKIEGDLRREVSINIKRLIDLKCYRGVRHVKKLPVRGQRTKTNARTRKGPKKLVTAKR